MSDINLEIGHELRTALPGFKVEGLQLESRHPICLASENFNRFLANAMRADCLDHATAACSAFCSDVGTLGWKVSRYRPSSAALLRNAKRAGFLLPRILPVVDVGNLISILTGLPVGIYDAEKIHDGAVVTLERKDASMLTIGKGEMGIRNCVVVRDGLGSFGSIVSDSIRTSITADTREFFLVLYCGRHDCPPEWIEIAQDCLENIESHSRLYAK